MGGPFFLQGTRMTDLEQLRDRALKEIAAVQDPAALQELRVRLLGRKSDLTAALRGLGALAPDERAKMGKLANVTKKAIENGLDGRAADLADARDSGLADREWFDLSLPGEEPPRGHKHPITIVEEDLADLFRPLGYRVVEGPWVEDEWHNFDALNMPSWHPARDAWDTFWLNDGNLLRTHTSPVQIRAMKRFGAPLRCVLPGRCFRNEDVDATHEAVFNQIEGLVIDRDIRPGHLFDSINHILSVILVEQFWSLANTITESEDGKRSYWFVGTGGLVGGIVGGRADALADSVHRWLER